MEDVKRITISATEAVRRLRELGMHISETRLVDEIEQGGIWPFGRIVRIGRSGRRSVEIIRKQFENWLEENL